MRATTARYAILGATILALSGCRTGTPANTASSGSGWNWVLDWKKPPTPAVTATPSGPHLPSANATPGGAPTNAYAPRRRKRVRLATRIRPARRTPISRHRIRPAGRVYEYECLTILMASRRRAAGRAPGGARRISRPKANRMPEPRTRWLRQTSPYSESYGQQQPAASQAYAPRALLPAATRPRPRQALTSHRSASSQPRPDARRLPMPTAPANSPPRDVARRQPTTNPRGGNPAEPNANNYAAPSSARRSKPRRPNRPRPAMLRSDGSERRAGPRPGGSQTGQHRYVPGQTGSSARHDSLSDARPTDTWLPTREKILTTGRAEQAITFRLMRPSLSPARSRPRLARSAHGLRRAACR